MEALNKIKNFIENLEEREFYIYLGSCLGILLLVVGLLVFQYYSNINYYRKHINNTNDSREEAQQILAKSSYVQQQRAAVNAMLAKDEGFKIGGYFKQLIDKFNLTKKIKIQTPSHIDRDEEYREHILNAKFENMNMQELTELLSTIEKNKRIYTKNLEIIKSKKIPRTIEVNLTIATLEPRVGPPALEG